MGQAWVWAWLLVAQADTNPPAAPAAPPAPIEATLSRLGDPVALLDGESRAERHLMFWDKKAPLRPGDGVRQGVAGVSEIAFSDFTVVRHFGATHVWREEPAAGPAGAASDFSGHVLRYQELRRIAVDARPAGMLLKLPGGYELRAANTWFRVVKDEFDGRYTVRNAGPGEVRVAGPFTPEGISAVTAGHEAVLPIPEQEAPVAAGSDRFEGRAVRLEQGVRRSREDDRLRLDGEGTATVGGARIHLRPGGGAVVWRPRP